MPAASIQIQDDTLHVHGVLDRNAVIALWAQINQLPPSLNVLNVQAVTGIDSSGLALLVELMAQLRIKGTANIIGKPPGLEELGAAYRLTPTLEFKR